MGGGGAGSGLSPFINPKNPKLSCSFGAGKVCRNRLKRYLFRNHKGDFTVPQSVTSKPYKVSGEQKEMRA